MSYPSSLKSLVGEGKRSLSTRQGEWGSGPEWPALGHMTSLGQPADSGPSEPAAPADIREGAWRAPGDRGGGRRAALSAWRGREVRGQPLHAGPDPPCHSPEQSCAFFWKGKPVCAGLPEPGLSSASP